MTRFADIFSDRPVLADGAMGTVLSARGVFINRCFDELNLSSADMVRGIHQEYVKAGAEILETNTFGATRQRLAAFGVAEKLQAINQAGVRLAREAASAKDGVFVAGQWDRLAFAFDRAGHRIEAQVAVLNARVAAAGGTAQHRTHAGGDFVQIEGFDDVIVGACIESRDSVLNLVASRENDDRRGVASLAQLAQHIDAVTVRQPKIEQHQVEMRGLQGGPRALAVAHPIHGEGRLAKRRVQALPNHFIVFNEQYTHAEQYPIAV